MLGGAAVGAGLALPNRRAMLLLAIDEGAGEPAERNEVGHGDATAAVEDHGSLVRLQDVCTGPEDQMRRVWAVRTASQ